MGDNTKDGGVVVLSHDPTVSNYFDSVHNLVHELAKYITIFREDVPKLYEVHSKGLCQSEVVDRTALFLVTENDAILRDRCVRFGSDALCLVRRKYAEVEDYIRSNDLYVENAKISISRDIMFYFSDYQQRLDWDLISAGYYGSHSHDGTDIYDIIEYANRKEDELERIKFNTIQEYVYRDITAIIDFGYRESTNTFQKLMHILDGSNSMYTSLRVVRIYIDILLLMCYVVEYVYVATEEHMNGSKIDEN